VLAVRWYLRYGLSFRDMEELLAKRGINVDHVTAHRWVQRFTPLLADAARFARHAPGDRRFVDDTYVKGQRRGASSIGPWTSMGRSSTSWCRNAATAKPPAGSSHRRLPR
jgi:hypothetical protein